MISRRTFLTASVLALPACDTNRTHEGALGYMERVNDRFQRALFNPRRLAPEPPASEITPDGIFPSYFVSETVPMMPAGWALEVGGMVARPLRLGLEELMRLPRTEMRVRHHCVEGWSAVASWTGVQVSEIAKLAGADPAAPFVEFQSFDNGYYSSWDRESALHPQSILAYGRNGGPLPPAYGAPLRLYSAVKLGYKMVKYVTAVRFLPARSGGYWEDRGYEWFAGV